MPRPPKYQFSFFDSKESGRFSRRKVIDHYGPRLRPRIRDRDVATKVRNFGKCWDYKTYRAKIATIYLLDLLKYRASVEIHRAIEHPLRRALREIGQFCNETDYQIRSVSSYLFRYQSDLQRKYATAKIKKDVLEWAKTNRKWASLPLSERWLHPKYQYWRQAAAEYNASRGVFDADPSLVADLSNHAWGTAIDINAKENAYGSTVWDMPAGIVRIMRKYGFDWGGYFSSHDAMHFEYMLPYTNQTQVYFPFHAGADVESPMKYYHANESQPGGYYPVNLLRGLHGGVHLSPTDAQAGKPTPVRCMLPGHVVAARFVSQDSEAHSPIAEDFSGGRHLGFVFVKHELHPVEDGKTRADKAITFYSLYMHLAPPNWTSLQEYQDRVPWLKKFFDLAHGGVVVLDPEDTDFGKNLWATAPFDGTASQFQVGDRVVPAQKDGRIAALGKDSPADVRTALDKLKAGCVISFDGPVIEVTAGEVVGFIAGGRSPFLHWEVLSPIGKSRGLGELVKMASEYAFKPFEEQKDVALKAALENNKAIGKLQLLRLNEEGLQLTFQTRGTGTSQKRQEVLVDLINDFNQSAQEQGCQLEQTEPDKDEFVLTCDSPPEDSGTLGFELEANEVLANLSQQATANNAWTEDQVMHVRACMFIPNGGHYHFGQPSAASDGHTGESDINAGTTLPTMDIEQVREKVPGFDFVSQHTLVELDRLGFGKVKCCMSATSVITEVQLYGDQSAWKKARPIFLFTIGGKTVRAGKINGNRLVEAWTVGAGDHGRKDRWGKTAELSILITRPEYLSHVPALPQVSFEIKPEVESFEPVVQGKNLLLKGKAKYVPTDRDLKVLCLFEDVSEDKALQERLTYRGRKANYGRCNADGDFEAEVPVEALADGKKRVFKWLRTYQKGNIWGRPFGGAQCTFPKSGS